MKYAKVIGQNTDFLTAQAFVFPRIMPEDDPDQLMIASVIVASGEDAFTKVRYNASLIEEAFFSETQKSVVKRLETIKQQFQEKLSDLESVHLLFVVWNKELLYLLSSGDNQAILLRGGKTFPLVEKNKELVSGFVKSGDRILLLSTRNIDSESQENLQWDQNTIDALMKTKIEDFEGEVPTTLLQENNKSPFSFILLTHGGSEDQVALENLENQSQNQKNADNHSKRLWHQLIPLKNHLIHLFKSGSSLFVHFLKIIVSKKKYLAVTVVGLILILGTLGYGITQFQKQQLQKTEVKRLLQEAKNLLSQAETQKNDQDPEAVSLSLANANAKIRLALAQDPASPEIKDFQNLINQKSDQLLGVFTIREWPVFMSLDLIKENFQTTQMSHSVDSILMLDSKQKTLVSVNLETKNTQILAGPLQLGNSKYVSLNGELAFSYSEDKGTQLVDLFSKKVTAVAKPEGSYISDIFAFGGNIYLLDSSGGQIWKYAPTATGFTEKQAYLKSDKPADFIGSKQLFIDYSVWVLKEEGEIIRFTGGVEDAFSIGGLDTPISDIKRIFVSEEEDKAYLLDSENSRIVVVKKNGPYLYQIKGDKFKTADDFLIDDQKKVLYLLEDGKIYQTPLSQ